ncbi:hypothetical protein GCM10023097_23530 [Streptomyces collinus]
MFLTELFMAVSTLSEIYSPGMREMSRSMAGSAIANSWGEVGCVSDARRKTPPRPDPVGVDGSHTPTAPA